MALLNPPQTLPHVMFLVYGYLLSAPKQTEGAETLRDLLAPKSLAHWKTGADDADAADKEADGIPPHQRIVQIAVNALRAVEIVESDGDDLRLTVPPPKRGHRLVAELAVFKRTLRERILNVERNRNLWSESGETIGSRDLTRALAWWLLQDIFIPVGPWPDKSPQGVQTLQQRQLGVDQKIFSNDTRWNTFVRWAVYLGFAWSYGQRTEKLTRTLLVPDPTEAVRETLPLVFGHEITMSLPDFVDALAYRLPVLDGGAHRQVVLDRINPGTVLIADGETLTTSLAHVLYRLEEEQVIELLNEADTTKRMLPVETGRAKPYSHIRFVASPARAA